MTDKPEIIVQQQAGWLPMSNEVMRDYESLAVPMLNLMRNAFDPDAPKPPPPVDPGPHPGYLRLVEAVAGDSLLAELVELHSPRWNGYGTGYRCTGDEYSGYDAEPPDWPCETVGVIARHRGVEP